eukprot:397853_1
MGCLIMGCVSSKNQIKTTEVHNTKTGDQITLLAKCMTFNDENIDINLCQHDVMIKLSGTETYDNHRLNSAEIYKWFEKRNHEIPSHFQECKQVLDQYDEYKQKQEKEEKQNNDNNIPVTGTHIQQISSNTAQFDDSTIVESIAESITTVDTLDVVRPQPFKTKKA